MLRLLARRVVVVAAIVFLSGLGVTAWLFFGDQGGTGSTAAAASDLKLEDIPFDGLQAYEYLKQLCPIRATAERFPGMRAQQKLLAEHFQKLGGPEWKSKFSTSGILTRLRWCPWRTSWFTGIRKVRPASCFAPLRHAAISAAG